ESRRGKAQAPPSARSTTIRPVATPPSVTNDVSPHDGRELHAVDASPARADSAATMTHEQLARRIADVALLRGEFTLRSGRKSNYYLDKYRFETQGDVLEALGRMFAERVAPSVDRIAGAELGAVPL